MYKNRKILLYSYSYISLIMNYSNFIVKVLKKPKQRFLKKNILLTELHVQFPSTRKKNKNNLNKMDLLIWGNLGEDIIKYYKINDYILIEGFISLHKRKINNNQEIKVSVSKIYPLNKNNLQINMK